MARIKLPNVYLQVACVILLSFVKLTQSKFLMLVDDQNLNYARDFSHGLTDFEEANENSFNFQLITYKNDSDWEQVCQAVSSSGGISAVLDLSHQIDSEMKPQTFFKERLIPYLKIDVPTDLLIKGSNALMEAKNASNGFLIFHGENDVSRGVHLILGHTLIRYAFLDAITMGKLIVEKFDYRIPSGVLLFGTAQQFQEFIKGKYAVVRNRTEWIFMFNSFQSSVVPLNVSFPHIRGYFDNKLCCQLQTSGQESCVESGCAGDPSGLYLKKLAYILSASLNSLESSLAKKYVLDCADDKKKADPNFEKAFTAKLTENSAGLFTISDGHLGLTSSLKFDDTGNTSVPNPIPVGQYNSKNFIQDSNYSFRKRPRYYRIGIVDFKPWTFKDAKGNWVGYCVDLAKGIATKMNFEFDFIPSADFGRRDPVTGRWDGLTGDLVHGKIDIAIAAYIMTSEREEFIDFVSPYYEQSGLIITMQRPVVKNSLFKFMTVLRAEVWLSIAGATVATGFMLWFLDKFSPYSAQNNPHKYKTFRKFTLKESFWFALTSFTPQGGGEPPKAFSGRTLVAAYWIFVVLMLATFTANLAAFLTVERMQSPIRNLEHLAGQSSVKYSVVNGSTALRFFQNMAKAEETLYQMWRNLTLSAPSSAKEYVVWEYPIREMYIHINSVIDKTGVISSFQEGLDKAAGDEYFAFIHDAAQTRYEVFRNCNLTLIGEPFAESPYAIAVAQGNPLQDDISMAILELQTNRFFETLSSRYWTSTCPNLGEGESDGISLESLGGVFIATIIGLGIAFISLAIEVFTTARNRRKAKIEADNIIKPKFIGPMDFYGATKKGEAFGRKVAFLPEVIN